MTLPLCAASADAADAAADAAGAADGLPLSVVLAHMRDKMLTERAELFMQEETVYVAAVAISRSFYKHGLRDSLTLCLGALTSPMTF